MRWDRRRRPTAGLGNCVYETTQESLLRSSWRRVRCGQLSSLFFGEVAFAEAPLANENWKVFRETTRVPTRAVSILSAASER
jgi:hypothetical protein